MTETISNIILASLGGVLPALVWLIFWLKEDAENPEPRKRIFITFILGMLGVPIALLLQIVFNEYIIHGASIENLISVDLLYGIGILFIWALIEEIIKLKSAYVGGLHERDADEAIDAPVYAITAALGFAALENVLFIFTTMVSEGATTALITGNMRFIGSTLLHVATSGTIGIFIAFSYFRTKRVKMSYLFFGLITATALHTLFNLFIILNENTPIFSFVGVWLLIVIIIILFEKIKSIHLNKI